MDTVSTYDNPYTLMSRTTGKDITELDHLEQGIIDLFTTPIGSRIDLPDYGSNLPLLLDKPFNSVWVAKANYWSIEALLRWEPRFYPYRVNFTMWDSKQGKIVVDIWGIYLLGGRRVAFQNLTLDFGKDRKFKRLS